MLFPVLQKAVVVKKNFCVKLYYNYGFICFIYSFQSFFIEVFVRNQMNCFFDLPNQPNIMVSKSKTKL